MAENGRIKNAVIRKSGDYDGELKKGQIAIIRKGGHFWRKTGESKMPS